MIASAFFMSFCSGIAERQLPWVPVGHTGDFGGDEQHFELRLLVR